MSYCPSHDWDRYCKANDPPEFCPVCGKPNFDEDTEEDIFPEDPVFCSATCRDKYIEEERLVTEQEARELVRQLDD